MNHQQVNIMAYRTMDCKLMDKKAYNLNFISICATYNYNEVEMSI